MNLLRLYNGIINKAKSENRRRGEIYYERHHILPRSMGGTDQKDNLVLLTAKEHFVVHHLLWRIHRNIPMALAFSNMQGTKSGRKISARAYEILMQETQISRRIGGKINGEAAKRNKLGAMGLTVEQKRNNGKVGGSRSGKAAFQSGQTLMASKTLADRRKKEFVEALVAAGYAPDYRISKREAFSLGITRFYGKICELHPELNGFRANRNSECIACATARKVSYNRSKKGKANE